MSKTKDTKFFIIIAQAILIVILLMAIVIRESSRGILGVGTGIDEVRASETIKKIEGAQIIKGDMNPMVTALYSETSLPETLDWSDINIHLNTVIHSNNYCTRRNAMARAAGLVAGEDMDYVNSPEIVAGMREVKMGSDTGSLVFVPHKITICKGDTVKWINNKGGPHNVVFYDACIPGGVDPELISMDGLLEFEDDTYTMKFDVPGQYDFYCEPHRESGMDGVLIVIE